MLVSTLIVTVFFTYGSAEEAPALNGTHMAPIFSPIGVRLVPDEYIVVLNDNVPDVVINTFRNLPNLASFKRFDSLLPGFSAKIPAAFLDVLRKNPWVKYIEPEFFMKINDGSCSNVDREVPWHLGRVSNQKRSQRVYSYSKQNGEGVVIYVLDTGIKTNHVDFGRRASFGETFSPDGDAADGHGHGTCVAGVAAGSQYGAAKKATVVAVKVFDSSGSGSDEQVIEGILWAVRDAQKHKKKSIINLSLGGGASAAVDDAVRRAHQAGLLVVAAAGNEGQDACYTSPARSQYACTVGASDVRDYFADFSNWGRCVNVIAPGVDIMCPAARGNRHSTTLSGTSFSAPLVSGLIADFWSQNNVSTSSLCREFQKRALKNRIRGVVGRTPNLLAFNGCNAQSS